MLNIVLVEPEIPQNTGNISRTCACTNTRLHIVKPLGFELSDRTLKRAGLDYWDKLDWTVYDDIDDFFRKNEGRVFYYLSTKAKNRYTDANFPDNCYLVFGKETKGLPEELLSANPDFSCTIVCKRFCINADNIATVKHILTDLFYSLGHNSFAPIFLRNVISQFSSSFMYIFLAKNENAKSFASDNSHFLILVIIFFNRNGRRTGIVFRNWVWYNSPGTDSPAKRDGHRIWEALLRDRNFLLTMILCVGRMKDNRIGMRKNYSNYFDAYGAENSKYMRFFAKKGGFFGGGN